MVKNLGINSALPIYLKLCNSDTCSIMKRAAQDILCELLGYESLLSQNVSGGRNRVTGKKREMLRRES